MKKIQLETIAQQINAARESSKDWPAWMKSAAYFSEAKVSAHSDAQKKEADNLKPNLV
jgi:hypothetical protein